MKEQTGHMMPARVQSKELDVEHVRQPGQGKPVAGVAGLKGPAGVGKGQSCCYVWILSDIFRIVVIEEVIMEHRRKGGDCYDSQEHANEDRAPGVVRVLCHETINFAPLPAGFQSANRGLF